VLDAKVGRRILSHALPNIDLLADNGPVSYLIQLIQDGNTNLRLGLDIAQGATGGYVSFEKGTIKTYTPNGFNELFAGNYDVSKGQNRFHLRMDLDLSHNQFLLTVNSLSDKQVLVDRSPAALNGCNPQDNGKRGLFLDCREGTVAIYDDLTFTQPDGTDMLRLDFERPLLKDG
jgi:hypothetical protein